MPMRDWDVRRALYQKVLDDHRDRSDTIVVNEFQLCDRNAIVDVAVVNGRLHGLEIKSEYDTLNRLPRQRDYYNQCLDQVTLVTAESHLVAALALIPDWWGVKLAIAGTRGAVRFEQHRMPQMNPNLDPQAVAALLWSAEAIAVLERHGAARGYRSKPRWDLKRRVAEVVPLDELRNEVRAAMKARPDWIAKHDRVELYLGSHKGQVVTRPQRAPRRRVAALGSIRKSCVPIDLGIPVAEC